MPHFKCAYCRARVWCEDSPDQSAPDPCPRCSGELEVVSDLSDLVGLRALRVRPHASHRDPADHFERISQQIRETIAAHDAERERRRNSDSP
jgi:hypothetical protein